MTKHTEPLLSVRDLNFKFNLRGQVLHALRDISLDVYPGESLAIVGESGSGKSVFVKCLMGLNDLNGFVESGSIEYDGKDLTLLKTDADWKSIRGSKIAMVLQDPMTSLNPLKTIGWQIEEAVTLHQGLKGADAKKAVYSILEEVGISDPERRAKQYPHEFSGGMRQRVVIAIAMACRPEILICDEPTTALDVTIQAQILGLIKEMQKKYNLTTIYITHDLGVVANVADRIAVMYAGEIVEVGTSDEVFYDPRHPYTWALLSSLPQLGVKGEPLYSIEGTPPNLFHEVKGDAFAPRNPKALKIDYVKRPPMFAVTATHSARTWLIDPRAPKVDPPEHILVLRERGKDLVAKAAAEGMISTGAAMPVTEEEMSDEAVGMSVSETLQPVGAGTSAPGTQQSGASGASASGVQQSGESKVSAPHTDEDKEVTARG